MPPIKTISKKCEKAKEAFKYAMDIYMKTQVPKPIRTQESVDENQRCHALIKDFKSKTKS